MVCSARTTAPTRTLTSRAWHRATLPALMLLPMVMSACTSPSLDKEVATVSSWTATARLAATDRRSGATTRVYTIQIRDRAAEALAESRRTMMESLRSRHDSMRAQVALDSLERALTLLAREVDAP